MNPDSLEITRDEWLPFFDAFSGMHRGWLVTLEVRGMRPDSEVRASGVPFEEIAAEGSRDGERISIVLRPTQSDEISHVVEAPAHVWLRREAWSSDASLEIESAQGITTLLRFNNAELPRPTDGLRS
jgi:hypothetical protein